jgi:hypothetical protein
MITESASQRRAADCTNVSSTACRSNVDRLMTLSTSAVAVCCCSDSRRLVEQPRVLDGDDCLSSKICHQRDLLVIEGAHLLAVHNNCTNKFVVLQHGNCNKRSDTSNFDSGNDVWITSFSEELLSCQIGNMDNRFGCDQATERISRTRTNGCAAAKLGKGKRGIVCRCEMQGVAVPAKYIAKLGITNASGILQDRCEHGLEITRSGTDDLKHLGGGGLLLQSFGQFARSLLLRLEQPHVFDRDHGLVGEGRDQLDLFVGKRVDLELERIGAQSERYFSNDPIVSLITIRQFGEVLAQLAAARSGLFSDANEPQADLLRRLRLDGNYPANVLDLFHQLRIDGNAATHRREGDHAKALACLKMARQLGIWFYRTFDDQHLKVGPFQPPRPPVDATAELAAELGRLRSERDAALSEAQRAKAAAMDAEAARLAAEKGAHGDPGHFAIGPWARAGYSKGPPSTRRLWTSHRSRRPFSTAHRPRALIRCGRKASICASVRPARWS